jgi:arginase
MHGMPLAFLLGLVENANKLPSFGWFKSCLRPSDIVYIGLRDLDPFEKRIIKELNIKAYTVRISLILSVHH